MFETATYMCDDTRGCVMQFLPPDDEHMCSKHVEAWNKLIFKTKFCASSRLITEIKTLHVSDSSSVHHQEFFTVNTATVYVIQVTLTACEQDRDGSVLILLASCQQTCMTYTIAVCTTQNSWWWTEELSETCRILFQKYIWAISASGCFYYKKNTRVLNQINPAHIFSFCFIMLNTDSILLSHSSLQVSPSKFCRHFPSPAPCATVPGYFIVLDFITLTTAGEEYEPWSSLLRNFLESPPTSTLLVPNIFLRILSSINFNPRSSHNNHITKKNWAHYVHYEAGEFVCDVSSSCGMLLWYARWVSNPVVNRHGRTPQNVWIYTQILQWVYSHLSKSLHVSTSSGPFTNRNYLLCHVLHHVQLPCLNTAYLVYWRN